ncbi:hypothetical protein IE00_01730 [Paracoccus sp. SM22M-07]|nr:hypothetical protein IE00_01730 [Paracoccus sp. SM22M-07]
MFLTFEVYQIDGRNLGPSVEHEDDALIAFAKSADTIQVGIVDNTPDLIFLHNGLINQIGLRNVEYLSHRGGDGDNISLVTLAIGKLYVVKFV